MEIFFLYIVDYYSTIKDLYDLVESKYNEKIVLAKK